MAAASGITSSIQTFLFGKSGHSTLSGTPVWADVVATGKVVGAALAANATAQRAIGNFIDDNVEIGDLGDSANILRFTPFGYPVEKTAAGVAGLSEWTFAVELDESNTAHKALRDAANGDEWEFAILTVTNFTASSEEATVDYCKGQIASKPKSFSPGALTRMTVTVALEESPIVIHHT